MLILILYYIIGFDPAVDPFAEDVTASSQAYSHAFRPNGVDELLLRWVRRNKLMTLIFKDADERPQNPFHFRQKSARIRETLRKVNALSTCASK